MPKQFDTEAELCAAFMSVLSKDWVAYPETCDFDIVLVRKKDGAQVGVEAKLQLNAKVLNQILPRLSEVFYDHPGPDFRAILVPDVKKHDLDNICDHLGVHVIRLRSKNSRAVTKHTRIAPESYSWHGEWHDWCPSKRLVLPDYVPVVEAGVPGPLKLTKWKIKAIKLCIVAKRRGYVSRKDFKELKLSPTIWLNRYSGWCDPTDTRGIWVLGDRAPDYEAMHPENYAQIEADYDKWIWPTPDVDVTTVSPPDIFNCN